MRAFEFTKDLIESDRVVDEMALPADWDETAFGHDKSFRSRLAYALERAPRLGGGSSRVAFTIEDNGRSTALKVAKNDKGLRQNGAEVDILGDGYISKLDIVIPLIDYDKKNPEPTWLQTELAQKATNKQLCNLMKTDYLDTVVQYAEIILGDRQEYMMNRVNNHMATLNDADQEIFIDYANQIAELVSAGDLHPMDLTRAANWGIFQGRPVVIDAGYTKEISKNYWRNSR